MSTAQYLREDDSSLSARRLRVVAFAIFAGAVYPRVQDVIAFLVVLGHPTYYPRFGFVPASRFGIDSEYDAPDEAFMVLELQADALRGRSGRVRYHHAFDDTR